MKKLCKYNPCENSVTTVKSLMFRGRQSENKKAALCFWHMDPKHSTQFQSSYFVFKGLAEKCNNVNRDSVFFLMHLLSGIFIGSITPSPSQIGPKRGPSSPFQSAWKFRCLLSSTHYASCTLSLERAWSSQRGRNNLWVNSCRGGLGVGRNHLGLLRGRFPPKSKRPM